MYIPVGLVPTRGDGWNAIATILKALVYPVMEKEGVIKPDDDCTNSSSASPHNGSAASSTKLPPAAIVALVFPQRFEPSPPTSIVLARIRSPLVPVTIAESHCTVGGVVVLLEQVPSPGELVATPEYSWTAPCQSATLAEKVTVI